MSVFFSPHNGNLTRKLDNFFAFKYDLTLVVGFNEMVDESNIYSFKYSLLRLTDKLQDYLFIDGLITTSDLIFYSREV